MASFIMLTFHILKKDKCTHLQFYIPFCVFYQCIPVISNMSILLLKNQKELCNIAEILIILHKTFFFAHILL